MLAVGLIAALASGSPSEALALPLRDPAETTVVADDAGSTLIGTGGLILPGTADEKTRQEVARCAGCSWRVTSPCVESALGNSFDQQPACGSVTRGCQVGSLRRTWFRPTSGSWHDLGLFCMLERPLTTELLGARVSERLTERVPEAGIVSLPSSGVVTGLPTIFASTIVAEPFTIDWRILGEQVRVTATPSYLWTFPDGTQVRTDDPGELSVAGAIRYVFSRSGAFPVTCLVEWSGSYALPGLGSFPISGVVRDTSTIAVLVGEGRALLRS